jgi:spoIIIJ-associated protein
MDRENVGNIVEMSGKTVEEAVSLALERMDTDRDSVDIEILDEGNKGIFGIIGARDAKVRVILKETFIEKVRNFLEEIFEKMNVNVQMEIEEQEDNTIHVMVEGIDSGIVIGRRGETLEAIQYLLCLAVNNGKEEYRKIIVDVENYREKRENTLIKLSGKLADRVIKTKKNITLEPMSPFERRIIHATLQNNKLIRTYSIGDEPNRKVVIAHQPSSGNRAKNFRR